MKLRLVLVLSLLLAGPIALADSLVDEDLILCSAVEIVVCTEDGVCENGEPWEFKVPQFVVFDLKKKELATTKASGENRSSPMVNLVRENGQIIVQGVENERAFSAVLHEEDGHITIALAIDGLAISAFGACTPTSGR